MIVADVTIQACSACIKTYDLLPVGACGLKVKFCFVDPVWQNLSKTAVFRNGNTTLDALIVDDCAVIPHELLAKVLDIVEVGVYGTDSNQLLAVPTIWGKLGAVVSAANPSGTSSAEPTLPYWAQIKEQVDTLENIIMESDDPSSSLIKPLPVTGGKMFGNVDMNENIITGLTAPSQLTDAVNLGYANAHYAPADYGIGTSCQEIDSWDNTIVNGFYKSKAGAPDDEEWWGHSVAFIEGGSQVQNVFKNGAYGMVHCVRNGSPGAWGEWEWVNPEMEMDKEYRTTERWNGKPVYTKLADLGPTEASGYKYLPIANINNLVRLVPNVAGILCGNWDASGAGANSINSFYFLATKVTGCIDMYVVCGNSYVGSTLYVQAWYTKD